MNGESDGRVRASVIRHRLIVHASIGVAILLAFVAAGWYFTSPAFKERVRARVTSELQRVTGGRVEIGSFEWNLSELQFDARDITIHGLEAPGQLPYAHINHVLLRLKIISVVREKVSVRYLGLEEPVIHLVTYADGGTNQPPPKPAEPHGKNSVERLFEIAIDRLDIKQGALIVNDHRTPLDFAATEVTARMDYTPHPKRYDGSIQIGKLDIKLSDMRPFASVAQMEFTIWPTAAELRSLQWTSGSSRLTANARLTDFNRPYIQLTYKGELDLADVSAITRTRQLQRGRVGLNGRASYSNGSYLSEGNFDLRELDVLTTAARIRRASLSGDYAASNQRLFLSHLSGRIFDGNVRGQIDVANWLSSTSQAQPGKAAPAAQRGAANFQFFGIPARTLAAAVASRSLPVDQLNLAGTVSGTADSTWRYSPLYAQTALVLDSSPPAPTRPGELPLEAHLRASYYGATHTLQLSQLTAATRASRVEASGALGATAANVKLVARTNNLGELQPVIAAFHGPKLLPINLHGQATFTGNLSGKLSSPTLAGHLRIDDFETLLVPPQKTSGSSKTTRQVHWDLLKADLELSPASFTARHGLLRRESAQVNFDVNTALSHFTFADSNRFSASVAIHQAELGDLETLAGYTYPVSGTLDFTANLAGTRADPHGNGRVHVVNGSIHGQPFQSLTASLAFVNHEAQFEDIHLVQQPAIVSGSAAYNLNTSAFRFNLEGGTFDLSKLEQLQMGRIGVRGTLDFSAQGSGTRQTPNISANLRFRNLVFSDEPWGNFTLDAVTRGRELEVTGRSDSANVSLNLEGNITLHDDLPSHLAIRFSRLDFDPLLRAYLKGHLTGHSSAAGTVLISGPLRRPRDLDVTADVGQFAANIENVELQNDGPIRFAVVQHKLSLQSFHLVGDGTNVTASGTAELLEPRRLDLRADGQINLKIVQTLNPQYTSSGLMTVALKVGGSTSTPNLHGRVQIKNGSLAQIDLPSGLSEINGTLAFNQNRLRVDSLTARTGGGMLKIGGFITYDHAITFNLTAQGTDVRLRYPPGMSTTANLDLQFTGSTASSLLSGDIVVTRFQVNRNFDFASYVAKAKQPSMLPSPSSPLNRLNLDVHITTTPELDVQTSIARVSGDADLRVRGTAARPVLLGRVEIAQGDVNFSGTRYHLERGDITFSNPVRIQPVLDLEATARVRDYDVTLRFTGEIDKLNTTYSSEPPLPTADIIALLAMGRTREESALQQPNTTFTQTASNAILGEALNATVSNRLEKLFGVSRIKIDPQAGGAENNPTGTRVTIEQQVSNKVTLTYITNVSQASQQIIQAEYYLTRNISLIALRDQNGVVSFDISIRQRKK